jgi:hypothetical protein
MLAALRTILARYFVASLVIIVDDHSLMIMLDDHA